MEHKLTVTNDVNISGVVRQNTRETVITDLERLAELRFDYRNHGELPLRHDAAEFAARYLFHPNHDQWWKDLDLQAVILNTAGVPVFQFIHPPSGRRVGLSVPCDGIIAWTKVLPDEPATKPKFQASLLPPEPEVKDQSTVTGYVRLSRDLSDPGWLQIYRACNWGRNQTNTGD